MSNTAPFPCCVFHPSAGRRGAKEHSHSPSSELISLFLAPPLFHPPRPSPSFHPAGTYSTVHSTRRSSNEEEGWKKSELESQRRREIKEAEVASVSFPRRKKGGKNSYLTFWIGRGRNKALNPLVTTATKEGVCFLCFFASSIPLIGKGGRDKTAPL